MRLICPECKNEVNLADYSDLAVDSVVECDTCGVTLLIRELGEEISAEIMDEGK